MTQTHILQHAMLSRVSQCYAALSWNALQRERLHSVHLLLDNKKEAVSGGKNGEISSWTNTCAKQRRMNIDQSMYYMQQHVFELSSQFLATLIHYNQPDYLWAQLNLDGGFSFIDIIKSWDYKVKWFKDIEPQVLILSKVKSDATFELYIL